jgi:hypothetical protein
MCQCEHTGLPLPAAVVVVVRMRKSEYFFVSLPAEIVRAP